MVQALGLTGLTEASHQQILAAHWVNATANPIIDGGEVSGTSGMTYSYNAGVVVIATSATQCVEVPFPAGQTAATTAPASGSATDYIYVNSAGQVILSRTYSPGLGALLDVRNVPSGITATTSTTSTLDRNWALPYGASLGVLARQDEYVADGTALPTADSGAYSVPFFVPTDRNVRAVVKANVRSSPANSTDMAFGSMLWTFLMDGVVFEQIESRFDRTCTQWEHTVEFVGPRALKAGRHQLDVRRKAQWGSAPYWFSAAPWAHGGTVIYDAGVSQ